MTKIYTRFYSSLFLAVLLVLGVASTALATQPTTSTSEMQGSVILADCGSFQVFDDYQGTIVKTTFYDNDGKRSQVHYAITGTDTFRHSVTGESITMGSYFMIRNDYRTGKNAAMGLQYHLMVPGLGQVLLDVGLMVYDTNVGDYVFFAGPHQVATGDTSGVCQAFG